MLILPKHKLFLRSNFDEIHKKMCSMYETKIKHYILASDDIQYYIYFIEKLIKKPIRIFSHQ